jgi:hypothetical protein
MEVVKTVTNPTWRDYVKTYYAKAIVVLSGLAAAITALTPVLAFLPVGDRGYVTGALAFIAGAVAFLKKEQALVDQL